MKKRTRRFLCALWPMICVFIVSSFNYQRAHLQRNGIRLLIAPTARLSPSDLMLAPLPTIQAGTLLISLSLSFTLSFNGKTITIIEEPRECKKKNIPLKIHIHLSIIHLNMLNISKKKTKKKQLFILWIGNAIITVNLKLIII